MHFRSLPNFTRFDVLQLTLALVLVCREAFLRSQRHVGAGIAILCRPAAGPIARVWQRRDQARVLCAHEDKERLDDQQASDDDGDAGLNRSPDKVLGRAFGVRRVKLHVEDHGRADRACSHGEDAERKETHGRHLGTLAHFEPVDQRDGEDEDDNVGDDIDDPDARVCGRQVATATALVDLVPVVANGSAY